MKKLLFLSLIVIILSIQSLAANADDIRGDANGDGQVNMGDVVKVERYLLLDEPVFPGADANLNGQVDIGDVTMIERIILGLEK